MADQWTVKELLASVKMNQLGNPKYSDAEQVAIIDASRLPGMVSYNTDDKSVNIYQSGTGSNFDITKLTNFLFRNSANVGVTSPKATVYDEGFINSRGKMENRVFVTLEYLQEVSIAGEIEIVVTDGSSPVTTTDTLSSDGAPVKKYITYIMDTTSFALNDQLDVQVKLTQVSVAFTEIRGV